MRDRLLPDWAFEGETYERKLREIIQSAKLTDAYPGEEGKKTIITAYLNNSFYGNNTYGVQAAAYGYFGKPMGELTLAQYAILAGIPQSPTSFNLMKNAEQVCTRSEGGRGGLRGLRAGRPRRPAISSSGGTTSSS